MQGWSGCAVVAGVAAAAVEGEEVMPEKLDPFCMFLFAQVCPACLEACGGFSL